MGLRREEKLEIPIVPLREAIINALVHRDYENRGTSTGLAIYDDRVEIENPGRLPHELSPETILQSHDSFPYNPIIAQALYKMTYLENWGSGIRKIADSCREAGLEEPTYSGGNKKHISKLKKTGKIVRIGPQTYGGKWEVID